MSGRTKAALLFAAFLAVATCLVAWHGIVVARPRTGSALAYGSELCRVRTEPLAPEPPRQWSDPAPGGHYRANPQGRYLALTREAVREYHAVLVWDETKRSFRSVVSIQEADPGSGPSHDYRWSLDGKALLIYGSGSLPFQPQPADLLYAYLPDEDQLLELPSCEGARGG